MFACVPGLSRVRRARPGTARCRGRRADPEARASPPRRHAAALGQPQRALAIPVRRGGRGPAGRLGEARCRGVRPHDRRPVPLGERALRHPSTEGGPEGRLVSPHFPRTRRLPRRITASGSASGRSTGGPTSGSTARRSAITRAATRPSSSTSPTPSSRDAENTVVVRAHDPTDPSLPTGKQVHWYTPSSGIWQTVWLEAQAAGLHRELPHHHSRRARPGDVPGRSRRAGEREGREPARGSPPLRRRAALPRRAGDHGVGRTGALRARDGRARAAALDPR